jgi:hypothetical protein
MAYVPRNGAGDLPTNYILEQVSSAQEKLAEAREEILIERETVHMSRKVVHAQRLKVGNAEATLMNLIREFLGRTGESIPENLNTAYGLAVKERDELGVVEYDHMQAVETLGGREWEFAEKENDFYQYGLQDIFSLAGVVPDTQNHPSPPLSPPPFFLLSPQPSEEISQQYNLINTALSSIEDDMKVDKWLFDQLKNSLMEKARFLIILKQNLERSGNFDFDYAVWEDRAASLWSLDKPDAQWMPSNVNCVPPDRLQQRLNSDSLHGASVIVGNEDIKTDGSTATHKVKQSQASLEHYMEKAPQDHYTGHVSGRSSVPVASPSGLERDTENTISALAIPEAELPHIGSEKEPHEDSEPWQSLDFQSGDTKKNHSQLKAYNQTGIKKFYNPTLVTALWRRISHLHLPSRRDSAVETNIKEQR